MAITYVGAGTSDATNGGTPPAPTLPAGLAVNDLMVAFFYSRESTDGTVSISAGWTQIYNDRTAGGLLAAWYRLFQNGDAAPTFTLGGHVGGNSGDTAIASIAAWRGINTSTPLDAQGTIATNVSQQNIGAITGISLGADDAVIVLGGKKDDWSAVDTLTGDGLSWVEIEQKSSIAGADAGLIWDYAINGGSPVTVTSKTFVVTGGASATGKGVIFSINVQPIVALAGSSAGVATAAGAASIRRSLAATVTGVSTVASSISIARSLAAAAAGLGTVAGAVSIRRGVAAISAGVATAVGALTVTGGGASVAMAGSSAGVATVSCAAAITRGLAGSSAGVASVRMATYAQRIFKDNYEPNPSCPWDEKDRAKWAVEYKGDDWALRQQANIIDSQ